MLSRPGLYTCGRCGQTKIAKQERVMCENGHARVAMDLDVQLPETLYATRKGGRSRGVIHLFDDCSHIADVDDDDLLDREWWAFDAEQDVCGTCLDRHHLAPDG